jgi:hypothetical protein
MSLDIALERVNSGATLTLSLSNKSAESLATNLDWMLVMSYPSMASDGTFSYSAYSEPAYKTGSQSPDQKGWVTYALTRKIAEYSSSPFVPMFESKLVVHLRKLVYGEKYVVQLYDLRLSTSSTTPFPITDNYARSKMLINLVTYYTQLGCTTLVREVSYGSDSSAREVDLHMFYLSTWVSPAVVRTH